MYSRYGICSQTLSSAKHGRGDTMWKLKARHAEQEILPPSFVFHLFKYFSKTFFSLDDVMNVIETCLIGKEHVNSERAVSLE